MMPFLDYIKGPLLARIKGLFLSPNKEWDAIEGEDRSIFDIYTNYLALLAAIPPLANFISTWLFGYSKGADVLQHVTFGAGLWHAVVQYALSLPAFYLIAFVISMMAPWFEGKSDDKRAFALVAYSFTAMFLASLFLLIPGIRWLAILGIYGAYTFVLGAPRMMRVPKDNSDVYTFLALVVMVATFELYTRVSHWIAPLTAG